MISAKQLTRLRNYQNYISIICFPLLFVLAANVWAGTETLDPDGDPTPDDWQLVNTTKHGAISDADDATYIWDDSPGSEKLSMADNTTIPSDAIIDSVMIHVRAKKNVGEGTATLKARIFNGATNYCDGNTINVLQVLQGYVFDAYVSPPTSAGVCSGTWTKADIDNLDVQLIWVAAGDNPRVVKMYAVVHWTEAGSGDPQDPATASGTNWTNSDSVFLSDDQRAKYANAGQNDLFATNFTIGAPTDATIDSIIVDVEGNGAGNSPGSRTIVVGLTKNGTTEAGDEVGQAMDKNTDNTYTIHGSTNALWGTTWTAAEVNSVNFGVTLNKSSTSTDEIRIDHIRTTVWWTESGEGGISGRRRKIQMGNTHTVDIEYARLDK